MGSKLVTRNAMSSGPGKICCNKAPTDVEPPPPPPSEDVDKVPDPEAEEDEEIKPFGRNSIRTIGSIWSQKSRTSQSKLKIFEPNGGGQPSSSSHPLVNVTSPSGEMKDELLHMQRRTLSKALAEQPMTAQDVQILSGTGAKVRDDPATLENIVHEHLRMQEEGEATSTVPCLEQSSRKRVAALMLAYDVIDSFEKKYQRTAFKDYPIPEMDQWAFFMFLIGQEARNKPHPLETYLDMMEASLVVWLRKVKKTDTAAITDAFHRMEGSYLRWAKDGLESDLQLLHKFSNTTQLDNQIDGDTTERAFVSKIAESTPSGSKSSGDRNFSRVSNGKASRGTKASKTRSSNTRSSNTRSSNTRSSNTRSGNTRSGNTRSGNTRSGNTRASNRRNHDSQHRGSVQNHGGSLAKKAIQEYENESGNEFEKEKQSTNENAKTARSHPQSVIGGAPTQSIAPTVRLKSNGSKKSNASDRSRRTDGIATTEVPKPTIAGDDAEKASEEKPPSKKKFGWGRWQQKN